MVIDMEFTKLFKLLSDETRIRILNILYRAETSLCVCDIENILNISQTKASKHLLKLKDNGLIKTEKRAQWVFSHLNNDILKEYKFLFYFFKQITDEVVYAEDLKRLEKYLKNGDIGNRCKIDLE